MLTLGDKYLPLKALVTPIMAPDVMLIDNSMPKTFGAKLDRAVEILSFRDCYTIIPAIHTTKKLSCHRIVL